MSSKAQACLLVVILSCGGCAVPPPLPEDHTYFLGDPPGRMLGLEALLRNKTISILPFKASGIYNERAILFQDQKQPNELQQYHYQYWVMPPGLALQDYLLKYFRQNAKNATLADLGMSSISDFRIDGKILNFEQHLGARTEIYLRIEIELFAGLSRKPLLLKVYETKKSQGQPGVPASIGVFNLAVADIVDQFSKDFLGAVRAFNSEVAR